MSAGSALAQGAHAHASHGGQVQKIGAYEVEFVARGGQIQLYILDDQDRPVDAGQFRATAVVLARGNDQRSVDMAPAGENRLAARLDFPVDGRVRATVTLRGTGGAEVGRARFSVDQAR
ncbi:hypothetical protein [Falsiroseomonas sp. CW058]|uniref:hypothetical protein n=1 Tax=Falsiroseomonas sp. CW058 TaxID=3388664 RepID=UPI003D31D52A